jgi:hypothetical protein
MCAKIARLIQLAIMEALADIIPSKVYIWTIVIVQRQKAANCNIDLTMSSQFTGRKFYVLWTKQFFANNPTQ